MSMVKDLRLPNPSLSRAQGRITCYIFAYHIMPSTHAFKGILFTICSMSFSSDHGTACNQLKFQHFEHSKPKGNQGKLVNVCCYIGSTRPGLDPKICCRLVSGPANFQPVSPLYITGEYIFIVVIGIVTSVTVLWLFSDGFVHPLEIDKIFFHCGHASVPNTLTR